MNKEEIKISANKILEMIYWLYQNNLKTGQLNKMKPAYAVGNQITKKSRFSMAKQASLFNKYEDEN